MANIRITSSIKAHDKHKLLHHATPVCSVLLTSRPNTPEYPPQTRRKSDL